jgi:hypothetical protein
MTRAIPAFTPKVHLDLLHPARHLWRLRLGSVRLKDLERHVLGRDGRSLDWSRRDDIDSSLIPQMYFDYLRGGPAEPIAGIFRHNQMDLRGLAALAGRIFEMLDCGRNGTTGNDRAEARDPIEVLGLSQLMRKRGEAARARVLYEAALQGGLPGSMERLAQRELALLAKRDLDYERANSLWDALRGTCPPAKPGVSPLIAEDERKTLETAIEAAEQLAIHYEHRAKDPQRALQFIREAVIEWSATRSEGTLARSREGKVHARLARRMARLERRCTGRLP